MVSTIPSFVTSCSKETSSKLDVVYEGKYLLWAAKEFDITEDHIVSATFEGKTVTDEFDISFKTSSNGLKINSQRVDDKGYKFTIDKGSDEGNYEFEICISYKDEISYSKTFYVTVCNFIPLNNFTIDNAGCATVSEDAFGNYDGIYIPDKIDGKTVTTFSIPGQSHPNIKTLAFDCESEVTYLGMYAIQGLFNLETVEIPAKLQGVKEYSIATVPNSNDSVTKIKKVIFDNVNFPRIFSKDAFLMGYRIDGTNPDLKEFVFNNLNNLQPFDTDDQYYRAFRTSYNESGTVTLINCGFDIETAKAFMEKPNRSLFNTGSDKTKWTYIEK